MANRAITIITKYIKLVTLAESGLVESLPNNIQSNPIGTYYDIGHDVNVEDNIKTMLVSTTHCKTTTSRTPIDVAQIVEIALVLWDRMMIVNEEREVEVPVDFVVGFVSSDGSIWITEQTDLRAG